MEYEEINKDTEVAPALIVDPIDLEFSCSRRRVEPPRLRPHVNFLSQYFGLVWFLIVDLDVLQKKPHH